MAEVNFLVKKGLTVPKGSAATPAVIFDASDPDTGLYSPGADQLAISTGGVRRATVDSSGRLLVGTSSTSSASTAILQGRSDNSTEGAVLRLARGLNNPADGSSLSAISFTDSGHTNAALIAAIRDGGTWTSGTSQPTRLAFSTTPDGSATPVERLRITSDGKLGIGTTSPGLPLEVVGSISATNGNVRATNGTTRYAILDYDTDGAVLRTAGLSMPWIFKIGNGTTDVERARIDSSGYLRLAGKGIQFNGDTADANSLDDYEEGTFTPTIVGTTTAGTATYTRQQGVYTKVGRQVFYAIDLIYSGGTGTGNLAIAGLPFTSAATSMLKAGSVYSTDITCPANTYICGATLSFTATQLIIQSALVGGGTSSNVAYDAAGQLVVTGHYFV